MGEEAAAGKIWFCDKNSTAKLQDCAQVWYFLLDILSPNRTCRTKSLPNGNGYRHSEKLTKRDLIYEDQNTYEKPQVFTCLARLLFDW